MSSWTAPRTIPRPPSPGRVLPSTVLLALAPLATLAAQTASPPPPPKTFYACYVPYVGTVYRIKEAGLPDHCFGPTTGPLMNIPFSWSDGAGALLTGTAAGGDLTGTYPNPGVGKLLGIALGTTAPTSGQVLGFNGTNWVATTPAAGVTAHSQLTGLLADDHPQYLLTNGTRALTGPLSMGGFKLTGLANGAASGDAVPFQQAVKSGDAAGGDLTGTYPAPGVGKLAGVPLASTAPASGQVLTFDGTTWAPAAPAAGLPPNIGCSQCTATGSAATALGASTQATGPFSFATGEGSKAPGVSAAAFGSGTKASGGGSLATGLNTVASGEASFASGEGVTAGGEASVALGHGVVAVDG